MSEEKECSIELSYVGKQDARVKKAMKSDSIFEVDIGMNPPHAILLQLRQKDSDAIKRMLETIEKLLGRPLPKPIQVYHEMKTDEPHRVYFFLGTTEKDFTDRTRDHVLTIE